MEVRKIGEIKEELKATADTVGIYPKICRR